MVRSHGVGSRYGVSQGQPVVRCGLTPKLDARAIEIPLWMFDAGLCGLMQIASTPVVCVDALRELKALLVLTRRSANTADPVLQAEPRDLLLSFTPYRDPPG